MWQTFLVKLHARHLHKDLKMTACQSKLVVVILYHQSVLSKGRYFTANSGTKAAVPPKCRSFTANSGTKVAVLLGLNRCGSFPVFSTPHSLCSIWTVLKRSEKIPGMEVRRVDLSNWAVRTSTKFTTGVKYQFHQGFWPDQRSGNPNHLFNINWHKTRKLWLEHAQSSKTLCLSPLIWPR